MPHDHPSNAIVLASPGLYERSRVAQVAGRPRCASLSDISNPPTHVHFELRTSLGRVPTITSSLQQGIYIDNLH